MAVGPPLAGRPRRQHGGHGRSCCGRVVVVVVVVVVISRRGRGRERRRVGSVVVIIIIIIGGISGGGACVGTKGGQGGSSTGGGLDAGRGNPTFSARLGDEESAEGGAAYIVVVQAKLSFLSLTPLPYLGLSSWRRIAAAADTFSDSTMGIGRRSFGPLVPVCCGGCGGPDDASSSGALAVVIIISACCIGM
jgi:hypothetical protein